MTPDEVPGLIPETTGNLLRDLASKVPTGRVIVEIGAYQGRSTCYLATGAAEGHSATVLSIDPWTTGTVTGPRGRPVFYLDPATESAYHKHLAACGVAGLVTPVRGVSQEVPLPERPVGLLWIDGDHEYPAVKADIRRWTPLVAAGGHVVFDDYKRHCRGVDRAVREFMRGAGSQWSWDTSLRPLAIGRCR